MNRVDKIKDFIEHNNLQFDSFSSSLNSNCVILVGYALYLGIEYEELSKIADLLGFSEEAKAELLRVYDFGEENLYGDWWYTEEAKKLYKF